MKLNSSWKSTTLTNFSMEGNKLKAAVAIVTGASSGIGRATAIHLAKNGAKVGLLARRQEKLKGLQASIESTGGKAMAVACDVTNREQVFDAFDQVRKQFGKVDILVNNAGVANFCRAFNVQVDAWLQVVDVNVIGTLHCCAAALQEMIARKSGHIVNISSVFGRTTYGKCAAYHGSKFFMQGHSAAMRQELASHGIKVTVVQPGPVTNTEIVLGRDLVYKEPRITDDPDVLEYLATTLPFKNSPGETLLEPEDIAASIIFALSQPDRVGVNEIMVEPKTVVYNSK